MKKLAVSFSMLAMLTAGLEPAWAEDTVKIVDITELSGSGAVDGGGWRDGIDLAVTEINAAGGILGHKIDLTHNDTQSDPSIARSVMQKALDENPYVVMGPVFSFETRATMGLAQQAKIPNISGAEASNITSIKNQYYFRSSLAQDFSLPKAVEYMSENMHAKSIVIFWENDDTGKTTRDVVSREAAARGIKVIADIPSDNNQADFAADVVRAKTLNPDAIYVHLVEQATARFLEEYRRQGATAPLIGDTTLTSQLVIQMAGEAVNGVRGWVGLSPVSKDPLIVDFVDKFQKRFGKIPDHNAMKAYMAVYAIKVVATKAGNFDHEAFIKGMHGITITKADDPHMLVDTSWDEKGDVDRPSFIVTVENGKQNVLAELPPQNKKK